jgi:hypothetical protein
MIAACGNAAMPASGLQTSTPATHWQPSKSRETICKKPRHTFPQYHSHNPTFSQHIHVASAGVCSNQPFPPECSSKHQNSMHGRAKSADSLDPNPKYPSTARSAPWGFAWPLQSLSYAAHASQAATTPFVRLVWKNTP